MTTATASAEETPFHRFISEFAASKLALFGLLVFILIALAAIFANWIGPQNPYDLAQLDIMDGRLPPGSHAAAGYTYLLGTDDQGRDMFSGMLYGLRISLAVGVGSAIFAACVGTTLGLLAAFFGRRIDAVIMRVVDLQLSFPSILVALMILAVLGKSVLNVVLALVIVEWAGYARNVRAIAMVERKREYIEAAMCLALPWRRIMFGHLLPNCLPPLIVIATQQVARAIALEATLSFLGLGVPITEPSLGLLIANGYQYMLSGKYWISFYPGLALLITIVSINLVGDHLRDVLKSAVETMSATLEVRNLRTYFFTRAGVVKAVDDVSFSVERGQVLGLVGEFGSGKSVTGFSIIGLIDPPGKLTGGSILYQGQDLAKLDEREMRHLRGNRIAMIFQDPMMTLNPVLRIDTQMIEAVLAHVQTTRTEARSRARDALGMVGIPSPEERLNAYPHQFSGGMRQRVAIAIALLHNPDLLIADEPTTALDVTIQAQILAEVQKLATDHGTALIWITHDLSVIAGLADRIAVMYAGRVVETGMATDVLDHPVHPYTHGLIGSVPSRNKRGERLRQIPGMTPSLLSLPPGCAFRTRCAHATAVCEAEPPTSEPSLGHTARCFHPVDGNAL